MKSEWLIQSIFKKVVAIRKERSFWFWALFSLPPSLAPLPKAVAGKESHGAQGTTGKGKA